MKRLLPILICIGLLISLCACGSEADDTTTYATTSPATTPTADTTAPNAPQTTEEPTTIPVSEIISDTLPITEPTPLPTVTDAPSEETTLGKTGEMAFSDDASNRYISAIAGKYSVDPSRLVAIYTVPQNDSNMVLEFNGTTDSSGRLVRNSSTLVAIYTIDADLNSRCASKDSSKNEYDYGEMMVMFITVTTYIMPEFEDKL